MRQFKWLKAWRELRRIMHSPSELAWRLFPGNAFGPLQPSPYNEAACRAMQSRETKR